MNSNDLKEFRNIFEDEMTDEGFVWKYQAYFHINFDQFWILAFWPRVTGQGHIFNMHYGLLLMNDIDPDDLHKTHFGNLFSLGELIRRINPVCKTFYGEQFNIKKSYQLLFEGYCQYVKPVIHRIQNSYGAYVFKRDFASLSYENDWIRTEKGMMYIEYLLPLKSEDEIQKVKNKIRNGQIVWEEQYNNREPPVYKEPSLLGHTPKSAVRLLEATKELTELEITQYKREQLLIIENRNKIAELEHMLDTNDHSELSRIVVNKMENISAKLKSRFSKKELDMMRTGWLNNSPNNTGDMFSAMMQK